MIALVIASLHSSHHLYLEQSATISRNTNRLVSQSIAGEIDQVDMGLREIQREYARQSASAQISKRELTYVLNHQQQMLPMVSGLGLTDTHGKLVVSSNSIKHLGVSLADRDYFSSLQKAPASGLVISQPLQSRISGQWILVFARSLVHADGRFGGIVLASVEIEWFNRKFSQLEVGPRGAVVLRGDASRDFDLLARFPQAGFVGQTKVSAQFRANITAHPQGGTYVAHAGADNISRTFSYQPVGSHPLITLVGLSTEDALAPWRREATKLALSVAVFILLSGLGGWLMLRAWNEIKHLAFYDSLTRLPNRRLLIDRLQLAVSSSVRSGMVGALLFLDLDDFKTLNDTMGHDIGDRLLQQTAQRIESILREGDTVARLGGDEFVVMLENLSDDILKAASRAETIGIKILSAFEPPYHIAQHEHRCTTSIGIAMFSGDRLDVEDILKQADIAMYQAKKAGRNTHRFFDPQMQNNINARSLLEKDLRKAIDADQFRLFYQLQVDSSRRAVGAEALIRWMHPERGLVMPLEFIPLAEETGLIVAIGKWVLDTACAQLKAWQADPLKQHLTLSVNVSARQFHERNFAALVKEAVLRNAIDPKLLKLEPTESILLENIEEAITTMKSLKEIGVHFSLDDFGTGFSSLQYLKQLPLNQLKIDQSFVRNITSEASDMAIVTTIIGMAHSLNLDVIAEGVETEEQRQFLENAGCKHFQGYLFSKALPADEFDELVKQL